MKNTETDSVTREDIAIQVPENLEKLLKEWKVARIQVKNRIDIGDKLRMISPTQSVEFTLEKIYSLAGEEVTSAHGGHVDVYITVPERPTEYALIRTQEDLGSVEKASKLHKEIKIGTKEYPIASIDISVSPLGYSWIEKKRHALIQSLRFFGVRTKSKISKIFGKKKKK